MRRNRCEVMKIAYKADAKLRASCYTLGMDKFTLPKRLHRWGARALCASLAGTVLALAVATPIYAQSLSTLQQEFSVARHRSEILSDQLQQLVGRVQSVSSQLASVDAQLQSAQQEHVWAQERYAATTRQLERDRALTRRATRLVADTRARARAMLVVWYEQQSVSYLDMLLQAHSLSNLLFRLRAMVLIQTSQRAQLAADAKTLEAFVRLTRKSLQEEESARAWSQKETTALERIATEETSQRALMAAVSQQKAAVAVQRASQIEALQRLASQISAVLAAQRAAAARAAAQRAAASHKGVATTAQEADVAGVLSAAQLQADMDTATQDAGVPTTWVPWLLTIVRFESGGNPSIVSSVPVDGEYATGLMQMLPSTFEEYELSGFTDIYNPIDNAIAAIRYIKADYGVPWNIPGLNGDGSYEGY
jgi:peptidoglycan hydrolase CwlO-like protein